MTTTALVPTFPGRPSWVRQAGAWVCVSIHDVAVLTQRSRWRQLILRSADSREAQEWAVRAYRRWLKTETAWYAALGLRLPSSAGWLVVPTEACCPLGHPIGTGRGCRICRRYRNTMAIRRLRARRGRLPMRERTTCKHGHPKTPENRVTSRYKGKIQVHCRACKTMRSKAWQAAHRAKPTRASSRYL